MVVVQEGLQGRWEDWVVNWRGFFRIIKCGEIAVNWKNLVRLTISFSPRMRTTRRKRVTRRWSTPLRNGVSKQVAHGRILALKMLFRPICTIFAAWAC